MEEAQVIEQCPSEASSISAAASERVDSKPKKKVVIEEEEESLNPEKPLFSSSCGPLGLKLSSMEEEEEEKSYENKTELHLFNQSDNMVSSPPSESSNEASGEKRVFTCNYCKRGFPTSQALGGHQNAHKQERALAKRRHGMDRSPFGNPPPPPYNNPYFPYYTSYPHVPLYGASSTFNRSALGVSAESMIHKPSSYHPWSISTGLGYGFGQQDLWPNKSALPKLNIKALQANNNSIDYSPPVMGSTSKLEGSGGAIHDLFGVSSVGSKLEGSGGAIHDLFGVSSVGSKLEESGGAIHDFFGVSSAGYASKLEGNGGAIHDFLGLSSNITNQNSANEVEGNGGIFHDFLVVSSNVSGQNLAAQEETATAGLAENKQPDAGLDLNLKL